MRPSDVVVIGGGVIGASVAHHLLERSPGLGVTLLEREGEVGTGATSKATGGVRHQFSSEANVRLTLLSYPYFAHAETLLGRPVDFVRHGYLFVTANPATLEASRASVALQRSLGVRSEILPPGDLKRFLVHLVTDDLVGASFCEDDGSADPHGLLQAFLGIARGRGLRVLTATPATGILTAGGRVAGVLTPEGEIGAPVVINCAGPHADALGALAGVLIPSKPYRRQVLVTEPLPSLPEVFPLIVDLDTGWYVHRQGRSAVLMGGTDKDQHPGHDTTVDWSAFGLVFEAAGRRVPPLADARVMRAYAGVRDLTPDYHGILGAAPGLGGFYVACGFSGHGFMHSPAIGRLMAELVLDGRATSMNIEPLSLERFSRGGTATEANMF
ncbi:MAG: FAD-binding oxidoreductase [Candidatus Rokubacteria bacterium]|nr:FAD-binding oxidoreductase [Candidatus Rokubacteria bacterium]